MLILHAALLARVMHGDGDGKDGRARRRAVVARVRQVVLLHDDALASLQLLLGVGLGDRWRLLVGH